MSAKSVNGGSRRFASLATPLFLVVILVGTAGACLSQTSANGCDSAQTNAAMQSCEGIRYQKAEQDLNVTYAHLISKLDDTGKAKLRAAQNAWLSFRRYNAAFQADSARGGSMASLIALTVSADMTEARTKELKKSEQP